MSPSSSYASFISCVCPGESATRTGLPSASTTAWIFVDGPPRERPISCAPLFRRARRVLVGAHDRSIDEVALVVALSRESREQTREHARRRPAREPRVHRLPRAVAARQVAPRRARPQNPEHPLDHRSVGLARPSAFLRCRGQHWPNPRPLRVCQPNQPFHPSRWNTLSAGWKAV